MGIAGRRRLVVQPGGLTLGFALHLVSYMSQHEHLRKLLVASVKLCQVSISQYG